jgi:hypothetical protein
MDKDKDGVALQAVDHPIGPPEITAAMLDAGEAAHRLLWSPTKTVREMLVAVYTAMVAAAPPAPELNEASLEEALVEARIAKALLLDIVERYAIKCAKGLIHEPSEQWPLGMPDDQKEFWRIFVRDLIVRLDAELAVAPRYMAPLSHGGGNDGRGGTQV